MQSLRQLRNQGRRILTILAGVLIIGAPELAVAEEVAGQDHPLEIHMSHWLEGSRDWRSENANFVPDSKPGEPGWVKEFGIKWDWGPNRKHLIGNIYVVLEDGSSFPSATMYAFYNPVTEEVMQVVVAFNGMLSIGHEKARDSKTNFGVPEVSDVLEFSELGVVTPVRHANRFDESGNQESKVLHRDDTGKWKEIQIWNWKRVPREAADTAG